MYENKEYIKELEGIIKQFLKPLNNVPYKVAIQAISGCRVIPFNRNDQKDKSLLSDLIMATSSATKKANQEGIFSSRVNEVGNKIEPFMIESLNEVGLKADRPITKEGKKKAIGYPDILVKDKYGRSSYIECKTYNQKNYQTTQRSFYFSPAKRLDDFKVIYDARHLVISFQIERTVKNGKNAYIPVHWKIFSLDSLLGQIKHEYNASNKQMYRKEALLAEGSV